MPITLFAHIGEPLEPHDLWTAWSFDPGIVIPLIVVAFLYVRGFRRASGLPRTQALWFAAGWLWLVIALVSPVHEMGEALFSAHMTQHEILMLLAAPCLVLGRPLVPFLWALPRSWRRIAGRVNRIPLLTNAFAAWLIGGIVLWVWHAPVLFNATLSSDFVHSLQHLSFLFSAILFWWALINGRRARMSYGMAVLYLFTTAVHTSILGALLTFSPTLWYTAYIGRTAAWGLTPLEDQQIGGLIMWVPASLVFIVAGLWMMALWLREAEMRAVKSTASALALIAAAALLQGCGIADQKLSKAAGQTGGDPWSGRNKISYYGCPSCHTIPGIRGANGLVGPPLSNIASRVYVGGVLPNTPDNMTRWIRNPKAVDPLAAMPMLNVTDRDARDITAYLYTLK